MQWRRQTVRTSARKLDGQRAVVPAEYVEEALSLASLELKSRRGHSSFSPMELLEKETEANKSSGSAELSNGFNSFYRVPKEHSSNVTKLTEGNMMTAHLTLPLISHFAGDSK